MNDNRIWKIVGTAGSTVDYVVATSQERAVEVLRDALGSSDAEAWFSGEITVVEVTELEAREIMRDGLSGPRSIWDVWQSDPEQVWLASRGWTPGGDAYAAKLEAEAEGREDSELWQILLDYGVSSEGKTLRAGISEALSILEHRVAHLATALERSGVDPSSVGVCGTCFGRGTETFGFPCQACGGTGQAAAAVARAR